MALPFDIAKDFYRALDQGNLDWAGRLISDDFTALGFANHGLRRREFLDIIEQLRAAFPDMRYDARDFQQLHHGIWLTTNVAGTHDGVAVFDEVGAIEPTGKSFRLPDEHPFLRIADGEIKELAIAPVPGGGIAGIFEQLGLDSPFRPLLPQPESMR